MEEGRDCFDWMGVRLGTLLKERLLRWFACVKQGIGVCDCLISEFSLKPKGRHWILG